MIKYWLTAVFLLTAVFAVEINPQELRDLGLQEIQAIQRYSGKEIELTLPPDLENIDSGTENYKIKAELSTKDLGKVLYIKYTISDLEDNFIKAFRVKGTASVWTDALFTNRTLYRGEEVTREDFYLERLDMLKYSRNLADETVFRDEQIMTSDLRPGMPLFGWMLSIKKLVNSGDRVALSVKSDGVTIKVEAKALQGGVRGDKILVQVQNEQRRTLQAEITGPGECEVQM